MVCDGTWNRPIVERREVAALDRLFLSSLQANDPDLVAGLAFDVAGLKRWTDQVQEFDDVVVTRRVLSESGRPVLRLEIACLVPRQMGLRIDRLLVNELRLSRSSIRKLAKAGRIFTVPPAFDLRRPPRDGLRLIIDAASLPESSLDHLIRAATTVSPPPPAAPRRCGSS
jgi:hypothetical protein